MGLFDLFRPRWKHSDADIRAAAIRELDESQNKVLTQVALGDQDPKIRRIAVRKIENPELLRKISKEDEDTDVKRAASEKLAVLFLPIVLSHKDEPRALAALHFLNEKDLIEAVLRAPLPAVSREALLHIHDPKCLAEIVRKSTDPHVQKSALLRISEKSVLKELALAPLSKELTREAIQKIQTLPILEDIFRLGNKNVRQIVKEFHLNFEETQGAGSEGSLSAAKKLEKRQKLCRQIEAAAVSTDWDLAAETLSLAKKAWAALGPIGTEGEEKELGDRFERSISQFRVRKQAALERLQKEAALEEQKQKILRQSTLRKEKVLATANSVEEVPKQIEVPATANLEEAYQAHLSRLQQICNELEQSIDTAPRKNLEERLRIGEEAAQNIDALPKDKQATIRARFQKIREILLTRIEEIKEISHWKRWSERTSLEQLCQRIEALRERPDGKQFLSELKSVREAFRAIPPSGPRAKEDKTNAELKERFHTGLKEAQKRAKVLVATLTEERLANLPKKEALCREAEALSNSGQWKETAARMKQLQLDWKAIGPVPKEQAQALRERFQKSCQHFFARLREQGKKRQEELEKNLKQKEALCLKVEGMSSSTEWRRTAVQLKRLQTEWKAVGPVPKSAALELNQRFRQACDQFFASKKAHEEQQEGQKQQRLSQKQALLKTLEQFLSSDANPSVFHQLKQSRADWKMAGVSSKDSSEETLDQKFHTLCEQLFEKNRSQFSESQKAELEKELSRFTNRISLPKVVS